MSFHEFMERMISLYPNGIVSEGEQYELVVATGLYLNTETNLVEEMPEESLKGRYQK